MKRGKYIASLGLLSAFVLSANAGEPIIFDHTAKSNVPKFQLERDKKLDDGTKFPDRKGSSVEAVVAPWQNPMNSGKLDAKQRKKLLEALDKKQNWAFQSGEEYLGTADLNSLDELDVDEDSFLSSDMDSKSSSLKLAERVYYGNKNKKESRNKLERTKRQKRYKEEKENLEAENKKNMTGEELLAQSGGVATPSFYQQQFDKQFQSSQMMRKDQSKEALGTMSQHDVTAASMLGMGNLVPDHYKQSNPSTGRSQSFQNLINSDFTGVTGNASESSFATSSASGLGGTESGGLLNNLSGATRSPTSSSELRTPFTTSNLNSSLQSLGSSRTLGGTPLDLGSGGFAPPSLGGGTFSPITRPSAAPSVQRPIFFEIPRRSF